LKVAIVLGTRPEIIKMAPIIRECQRQDLDFFILHSGQHYSYEMDQTFFKQLELPEARYNLDVGSGNHGEQTGKALHGIEKVLIDEKPDFTLVEGDTNTVLAGALAASKLRLPVGHVEAGLRSYDRDMPEETNRIVADHISDYLFAPTETSKRNLINEGLDESRIYVTGNTVVDAVNQNLAIAEQESNVLEDLGLTKDGFFLATVHRQENTDDVDRLRNILDGLELVSREYGKPVLYPVHPRARKRIEEFHLDYTGLRIIDPVDYLGFLRLMGEATLILTDSGGVQEESCILGVRCVTLRDNTERPETIEVGANLLAGTRPASILEHVQKSLQNPTGWKNPFGDGEAGKKIMEILKVAG
jgi:UDP-N-acetylglucosamine 2-epimerase (non-hydrolysing)